MVLEEEVVVVPELPGLFQAKEVHLVVVLEVPVVVGKQLYGPHSGQ